MSQLIISVSREFGSGGHEIAQNLAKAYHLPLYDHNLLDEIAKDKNLNKDELAEHDEKKKNPLLYRTVRGLSSSPAQNIALLQFDYLKKKAAAGESFVIVGRCSETVLKEYDGLVSIFVRGDLDKKTARVCEKYNLTAEKAHKLIATKDSKRKKYHDDHCEGKWGDSGNYDLCVNSSKLSMENTIRLLTTYIDLRNA